ncbi:MAG: hypothetical protein GYA59_06355 [Chloroflexi bacterium]|nr:hypothetical protein [Chloroflexota bacterium]
MSKQSDYQQALRNMEDWEAFLLKESCLPGPRSNLELLYAVREEGDEARLTRFFRYPLEQAATNTPGEFLVACGVAGLGRLVAEGQLDWLKTLRAFASDPRWRVREAVAMALQRFGSQNMESLLKEMRVWSQGSPLERRAVVAAVCEPALLRQPEHAEAVLNLLDEITASILQAPDRKSEDFRVLRQALGYGLSVAAVASPQAGKRLLEKWLATPDKDIRWILKENLKKQRLIRMDPAWVESCLKSLS